MNVKLKQETSEAFKLMVDDVVQFSQYDPELADGIKWLDGLAQKEGVSFYDKVYEVLYKHDSKEKAKEWMKTITRKTSNTSGKFGEDK